MTGRINVDVMTVARFVLAPEMGANPALDTTRAIIHLPPLAEKTFSMISIMCSLCRRTLDETDQSSGAATNCVQGVAGGLAGSAQTGAGRS